MTEGDAPAPGSSDITSIKVCVRVRPINDRERGEGHRTCVSFDEPSRQVVLTAVDKNTLLQLRGSTAKGYAFDRRYAQDTVSDTIYEDCVSELVESCFKGYNATVLAYGQTGSGKTHTMSGGVGIHGTVEEGITPRVIRHLFSVSEQLTKKAKPGEKVEITASALELYNEDLLDLSQRSGRDDPAKTTGWDGKAACQGLKLQERPSGKEGRVVPEVVGLREMKVRTAEELRKFYDDCMENRSTSSTKLNDRSSRSHALFTVSIHRTIVEVTNELSEDFKAKVRTQEFVSKLHLVDLAGSERVKRSGVTGKELKEATHINSGLLALGNVIVALSNEAETKKKGHVPYRDSKLTRLLQDSLGGNSLTVLISCISPSEMDFEETNNTLKYANRACHIKNTPLPNKFTTLEEDLLPSIPAEGGMGLVHIQALLEDHERMKEIRERKERERAEKDSRRLAALASLKEEQSQMKGFQRMRANQYDELRRQLAPKGTVNIPQGQVIADDTLVSFGHKNRLAQSVDGPLTPNSMATSTNFQPRSARATAGRAQKATPGGSRGHAGSQSVKVTSKPCGQSFADWLASQQGNDSGAEGSAGGEEAHDAMATYEDMEGGHDAAEQSFIVDDNEAGHIFADDAEAHDAPPAPTVTKSKFRRGGAAKPAADPVEEVADNVSNLALEAPQQEDEAAVELGEDDDVLLEEVQEEEEALPFDPIQDNAKPKLLARFKVNTMDTLAVFKAVSKEDFKDVIGLLPENTPLPASDKMTYLLARLEVNSQRDLPAALQRVGAGQMSMNEAVGPAVGCLMATFGTNMISSCIFVFEDPDDLRQVFTPLYDVEERIELWGLQIPHNSVRPPLEESTEGAAAAEDGQAAKDSGSVITWTSVDRLNMSIGLLYALCNHALDSGIKCGFCVPRPQLLKRWLQAGVKMRQIPTDTLKLIYPPSAHDYEYYKASTVAYFMITEVREALEKVLGMVH